MRYQDDTVTDSVLQDISAGNHARAGVLHGFLRSVDGVEAVKTGIDDVRFLRVGSIQKYRTVASLVINSKARNYQFLLYTNESMIEQGVELYYHR
jgi:hypothetical protein